MSTDAFSELQWRDLVYDSSEGTDKALATEKLTIYNGFDPTADSLTVGHLMPMMGLARLQRFGHTPIAIAGGGTGMIGDPGGKSKERNLLTEEQVEHNLEKLQAQLALIMDFEVQSNPARIINNATWLKPLPMMTFLRDVGKHFTVNYMKAKESVRSRIDREDGGISFTEFSYMLLQAYDFLVLFEQHDCRMQTGGSDQWGNITAGIDLIRRKHSAKAHGLVYPLLTKADGTKFGKTEAGAVWLDPQRTSPYRFYQFWLNCEDEKVVGYLKALTWLDKAAIGELAVALDERPHERLPQRRLAEAITEMVHGPTALARAEHATKVLFGGSLDGLEGDDVADIFRDVPSSQQPRAALDGDGLAIVDLLVDSALATSRGDARRAIEGGGIYVNNERVAEVGATVPLSQAIDGRFLVLRKGRKKYHLVRLVA